MQTIKPFTDESAERLRAFLESPERSEGTMGLCKAGGFLFAVACSPRMVQPSDWVPEIFGGDQPEYETMEEARGILDMLLSFYNHVQSGVHEGRPALPPGCAAAPKPLANLGEDTPLGAWSQGFLEGHGWLEELWEGLIPDELDQELGTQLMVLSFFSSRRLAEAFHRESGGEHSLESMAESMLRIFPDAMAGYAHLARSIDRALRELEESRRPVRSTKVGRNEPCPCGSGRKYKRCCGAH
jgi:uncharacterized protein